MPPRSPPGGEGPTKEIPKIQLNERLEGKIISIRMCHLRTAAHFTFSPPLPEREDRGNHPA